MLMSALVSRVQGFAPRQQPYRAVILSSRYLSSGSDRQSIAHTRTSPVLSELSSSIDSYRSQFLSHSASFPHVTSTQWAQLSAYCALLGAWNERKNFVSRADVEFLVTKHVVPSMGLALCVPRSKGVRVIDVGTGGGLPGIPLSILNPNAQVTLLDSSVSKINIVESMCRDLNLKNVRVTASPVESHLGRYDLVVGRGVTALSRFVQLTRHLVDLQSRKEQGSLSLDEAAILYLTGAERSVHVDALRECSIHEMDYPAVSSLVPTVTSEKAVVILNASSIAMSFRKKASKANFKNYIDR